ncbi:MAG: TetR/AcrR family transcriptional regulator [Bacteroidetes bacterium]|nr:TetR/AcrR family transcriptional regulator [Bacteroidota bacterium]MBS1977153.1 TetR/AcrR family transcriptional regulator [Bacteroidota bacterium]
MLNNLVKHLKDDRTTEEKILDAASMVFTKKGFAATRTEDIARQAGMNRALLHYYYRDKQTIFNIIFETRFSEFFKGLFVIFDAGNISFFEKIRRMIHHEINTLLKHPDLARFVINEIAQDPERLLKHGSKIGINPRILIEAFEKQTEEEIKNGTIRPIEGRMLLIHIMSLCLYPFVARPVLETLMQLNSEQFTALMERRKEETYEFIINSIKK